MYSDCGIRIPEGNKEDRCMLTKRSHIADKNCRKDVEYHGSRLVDVNSPRSDRIQNPTQHETSRTKGLGEPSSLEFEAELPSSSQFIPIKACKGMRSITPSTRESVREDMVLEDLNESQTFILPSSPSPTSERPPCRASRVRLSEINSTDLCPIFHSRIPAIGHWIREDRIGEGSQGSIYMGSSISHHGFRFAVKIIQAPIGG